MAFGLEHLGGNQGCERAQGFCAAPGPACVSVFGLGVRQPEPRGKLERALVPVSRARRSVFVRVSKKFPPVFRNISRAGDRRRVSDTVERPDDSTCKNESKICYGLFFHESPFSSESILNIFGAREPSDAAASDHVLDVST